MKKILSIIALTACVIGTNAIPAKRGIWRNITLEDGTTLRVELRGDEYMHHWQAEDGRCFVRTQNGEYVKAEWEELAQKHEENMAMVKGVAGPRKSHFASTADGLGEYGVSGMGSVKSIGEVTIPVILVDFDDIQFQESNNIDKMNRYFNEEGYHDEARCVGSARDYFISQSYGLFKPSFPVVAHVKVSKEHAEYGGNSGERGTDKNVMGMVREAITAAVEQGVDFSQYYVNNSVPLVSFIYAGQGENGGQDEDAIWPHQSDLYSYNSIISGFNFKSYFVGNEISVYKTLEGIGTFCHEFGHGIGLPDFYCTDYSYSKSPMGNWSIMDTGADLNYGRTPIGYLAYERSYLGWLKIPEITSPQGIVLGDPEVEGSTPAVLYRNPKNNKEYFIFENKQTGTWFPSGMGGGMLVTRFSYLRDQWGYNVLNNTESAKRAMVVTADNAELYYSVGESNLFGNAVINMPTWTYFDNTECTTFPIYKVMKHSDRTVSMNVMGNDLEYTYKPETGTRYTLVDNASNLQAGDTIVIVNKEDAIALGLIQTTEARMGACVNILDDNTVLAEDNVQEIVLRQTANGYWAFQVDDVYLTTVTSGGKLVGTNKPSTNATATIDINNGNAEITFQIKNASKNVRYDIENTNFKCFSTDGMAVQIYRKASNTDGIRNAVANNTTPAHKGAYTLTGQKEDRNNLKKGIHILDGKKVIVR